MSIYKQLKRGAEQDAARNAARWDRHPLAAFTFRAVVCGTAVIIGLASACNDEPAGAQQTQEDFR